MSKTSLVCEFSARYFFFFLFSFFYHTLRYLYLLYLLLFEGPWHELAKKNSKMYKKVYSLAVPDGEAATFDLYLFSITLNLFYIPSNSTRFDLIRFYSILFEFFEIFEFLEFCLYSLTSEDMMKKDEGPFSELTLLVLDSRIGM